MSRTDKDMPYWVTAEWWEPEHWHCENVTPWLRQWGARGPRRACDLPDQPVVAPPVRHTWRGRSMKTCTWVPDDNRHPVGRAPRWYIHHTWTGPQRVKVRDRGRRAIAEYRATGEVDVELPRRQHRHGANWYWW